MIICGTVRHLIHSVVDNLVVALRLHVRVISLPVYIFDSTYHSERDKTGNR